MHLPKSSIVRVCGAAAALFLFGCGSSSIAGDPAANFAGNWTFGSGSIQPMCSGFTIAPVDLTGDVLSIVRVDPTHVSTSLTGSGIMCNVNFTVTGTMATAVSGQTCVVTVPVSTSNVAVTVDISAWTLTVSGDTLSMSMNGTATAAGILSCTPTADGSATRAAADGGTGG
jgi:hypothetical protein